jgi:hypothetical protein
MKTVVIFTFISSVGPIVQIRALCIHRALCLCSRDTMPVSISQLLACLCTLRTKLHYDCIRYYPNNKAFMCNPIFVISLHRGKVKVKQYHYSPGEALRVPGCWRSQLSRQSSHEAGEVVSPRHRPPLPPRKYSWYSRVWVNPRAIVRSEYLCQWKIPVTPSWIEPATFRLVAQCLNYSATAYPQYTKIKPIKLIFIPTHCHM